MSAAPPPAPPALPDAPHVLVFLNRTIAWRNSVDGQAALSAAMTPLAKRRILRDAYAPIASATFRPTPPQSSPPQQA